MTIKTTGQLKFSEIEAEFKQGANPIMLSEYYRGGPNVPDGPPANANIAKTGLEKVSNYYGATKTVKDPIVEEIENQAMGFYYMAGNATHGNTVTMGPGATGASAFGNLPYNAGIFDDVLAGTTPYLDNIIDQAKLTGPFTYPAGSRSALNPAIGKGAAFITRYVTDPSWPYRYVYKEENASKGIGYWTGMTSANNSSHTYPTVTFPAFSFKPKKDGWWIMVYAAVNRDELPGLTLGDGAAGFLLFNMRTASRQFASSIVIDPTKDKLQVTLGKASPQLRWDLFKVGSYGSTTLRYHAAPSGYKPSGWMPFIIAVSNELEATPNGYGGDQIMHKIKAFSDRDLPGFNIPPRVGDPIEGFPAGQIQPTSGWSNAGFRADAGLAAEGWGKGGITNNISSQWTQPIGPVNMILEAGQIPNCVRIYATAGAEGVLDQAHFDKMATYWKSQWGH